MSNLTTRALRAVALIVLLGGALAAAPVAGQELDGDVYTDEDYGWSVAFDDTVWTAEVADGEGSRGVSLASGVHFASLLVDEGSDDAADCLARLASSFSAAEGWDELVPARRLDAPETSAQAEGALYTTTITPTDGGDAIDLALYLECRELDGATLAVSISAVEERYEGAVPELEALLAGIETDLVSTNPDNRTPEREETPERDDPGFVENDVAAGEIDGDTFTDTALGYAFSWDDRVWAGELVAEAETAAVGLTSDDELFATVTVDASLGYAGIGPAQCVSEYAGSYAATDGYTPFRRDRSLDGPAAPDGAFGEGYTFTFTYPDGEEADLVAYIECRPISDDAMVRVIIQTTEASLDANLPVFEELLAGIEIEEPGDQDAADEKSPDLLDPRRDEATPAG